MTPAQLHKIAREERARRKAAWDRAGKAGSDQAKHDDRLWSNIEQMAAIEAGDPTALSRQPQHWNDQERIAMARNIWATILKAETSLDTAIAANQEKLVGLSHLFRFVRPLGWSPFATEAA